MDDTFDRFFSKIKSSASAELYNTEVGAAIVINWSLTGFGFGELVLSYRKEESKWVADTECMSEETVTKILELAAPSLAKLYMEHDPK